jgi:hypothetical protein
MPTENAIEKTVRLLDRVNERFADPDVPGMESLRLVLDRKGGCILIDGVGVSLYAAPLDQMGKFLSAPVAAQVRAIRGRVA